MNNPTGSLNQVTQTLATESFISQLRIASGWGRKRGLAPNERPSVLLPRAYAQAHSSLP